MDTQSSNQSSEDVLAAVQLGERVLAQLGLYARVAQIEARQAELESMLVHARHGDVAPLQQWLKVHGEYLPGREYGISPSSNQAEQAEQAFQSWDVFRQFAVARLQQRQSLSIGLLAQSVLPGSIDQRQGATELGVAADIRLDRSHVASREDTLADETENSHPPTPRTATELDAIEAERVSPELLAELKLVEAKTGIQAGIKVHGIQGQTLTSASRWRGVVVSAVLHVLLVFLLAVVTLDTPMKDGLLSLVASDTAASVEVESFELTQEVEVQEPADQPLETLTADAQPNLAEVLPGFNESLSQALTQTVSSANTADSKSLMMAATASATSEMVSFYGAESSGNSFCFVVDGSGSMRGGPWEAARLELLRSISSMKPQQKFYIIFFNQEVIAIPQIGENQPARSALSATPENIAHARRWLDTLQIATGEPPMKALEAALQLECDCIYFLADGEMSDSIAKKLFDSLKKHNRAHDIIDGEVVLVPIHTIAFYSDKGLDIMRRIAAENRGQFAYVPKPTRPVPRSTRPKNGPN